MVLDPESARSHATQIHRAAGNVRPGDTQCIEVVVMLRGAHFVARSLARQSDDLQLLPSAASRFRLR